MTTHVFLFLHEILNLGNDELEQSIHGLFMVF